LSTVATASPRLKFRLPSSPLRPELGVTAFPAIPTSVLLTLASSFGSCSSVRIAVPRYADPVTVSLPPPTVWSTPCALGTGTKATTAMTAPRRSAQVQPAIPSPGRVERPVTLLACLAHAHRGLSARGGDDRSSI